MDWSALILAIGTFALGWLAKRIKDGKPPLVDPANKYPALDEVRDAAREVIKETQHGDD